MARTSITCCYKCEERTPGCHATCERYLKETQELSVTRKKESWSRGRSKAYVTGARKNKPTKPGQM